jgi:glycosyltransferase involved in cell wall biosynthesis
MRIAIFDYKVISSNPSGGCHLTLLRSLAREHDFTVFSVQFENPDPDNIVWVRVPAPTRPLALLFICFHLMAPWVYLWHRIRTRKRFDIVQSVESNLSFGKLVYSHFSHTGYLDHYSAPPSDLRSLLRWVDHWLHACMERFRYPVAKLLVIPSNGLAQELQNEFSIASSKLSVIANPVRVKHMIHPADFNREQFRRELGFSASDLVIVFSALGQFERKGLPLLIDSLAALAVSRTRLLVIGGEDDLIARYQQRVAEAGIGNRVCFAGMQSDVRPFLWCGDAFALPSAYESFSLATYEAAAAGLPILAPALNGIRDLLRDGENGFLITRDVSSIAHALERLTKLSVKERLLMGHNARQAAMHYSEERFAESWRNLYGHWKDSFVPQLHSDQKLLPRDQHA